jgi:hypothetical protein
MVRPRISLKRPQLAHFLFMSLAFAAIACEPTVRLATPDKPIVINLNIRIEQEVRVKVERDIEELLRENDELF